MTSEIDDPPDYGPAMSALTSGQQRFVLAVMTQGEENFTRAYMEAYPAASYETANVNGFRLAHSTKILEAFHEEASRRLRSAAVLGANIIRRIAADPTHKDQLKAAQTLLNRIGLHEKTEHKVTVERPTDDIDIKRQIVALAKDLGWSDDELRKALGPNADISMLALPAPAQPFTIDAEVGEFVEIENSTEGLEDVL